MKKSKIKNQKYLSALVLVFLLALPSCDKMLDAKNTNDVEYDHHYNNFNDADNAIIGIYGKLMGLVDRVIVLNELRGDLMDVTANATFDQISLNNHTASHNNHYCDLAPFYEIILNCNDVLANFVKMKEEKKMSADNFEFRYAEVMTVRCWTYLQMAIHFGSIPYIEKPFVTVDDLKDASRYPVLPYEQILAKLVACMRELSEPVLNVRMNAPLFAAAASATDNVNLKMFLLNKHFVFGDLLLYSHQYAAAADQYLKVITDAENQGWANVGTTTLYKVRNGGDFSSSNSHFYIGYVRGQTSSEGYGNKWNQIFMYPSTNRDLSAEMINMFEYKASFSPQYPLIELFAPNGKGKYQLKPSQYAIDDLWNAQDHRGSRNVRFDGRGIGSAFDWYNGQPVVIKYLFDYYKRNEVIFPLNMDVVEMRLNLTDHEDVNRLNGRWFIYRAGLLHLRYAEAANRAGYPDLALAMLQGGIRSRYGWSRPTTDPPTPSCGWANLQYYSGYRPSGVEASVRYPDPFFLDGRSNTSANECDYVAARPWSSHEGIRNRAYVQNVPVPALTNKQDSIFWMEEVLLQEAALECGFEGFRWGDLVRIAHRKNADNGTGTAFLNEQLRKKFEKEGKAAPQFSSENDWFLQRKD